MDSWLTFLLIAAGLAGHVILWTAIVNRVHGLAILRWMIDALTLTSGVALVIIPLAILWTAIRNHWVLGGPSVAYFGACSLLFGWSVLDHWWVRSADRSESAQLGNHTSVLDLRQSHGNDLLAPGIVRFLGSLPGNEVLRIHVHEKQLAIPNLPQALDGLRIAHLSDLHVSGRIGPEYYAAVVERVNQWHPDIIAITGDIVENEPSIELTARVLSELKAEHGVFFVLGNHDKKTDHERIRKSMVSAGLVDMGGVSQEVPFRGEKILIAGNELPWFPIKQENPAERATFRLLLAHGPDQFKWAKERGFHLMLAGHNHGGQICFPVVGAVVAPSITGTRFAGGLFRQGNTLLHVSRGTGSLSPIRWNCPPEIALLTLRTATNS